MPVVTQRIVLIGSGPNSGTGDNLYTAFKKINDNFTEVYTGAVTIGTSGLQQQFETIFNNGVPIIEEQVTAAVLSQIGTIAATTITGNLHVTGTNVTVNTYSGALIVDGGIGVGGDIYVGGMVTASDFQINGFSVNTTTFDGGLITTPLTINTTTISNSTLSGALVVKGGAGIGGTLNATRINATSIQINGVNLSTSTIFNGGSVSGAVNITNSIGSITTSTGALTVAGGVGVARNITVGYDTVGGSAYFGDPYSASGINQILFTRIYNVNTGSSSGVAHVLQSTTSSSNGSTISLYAFNTASSSTYTNRTLRVGTGGIFSTSTNGLLFWETIGPSIKFIVQNTATSVTITSATNTIDYKVATLVVTGGLGVSGNTYVNGLVTATSLATTSITTFPVGSNANLLIDPDGGGDVIFSTATQVVIYDTATCISTTTGALVVTGGVGIGGNLNVGGSLNVSGAVTFSGTITNIISTNTVYTDNIIELHYPNNSGNTWTIDDGKDIGLRFHYYDTQDRNGFLGRDSGTGYLEWVVNANADNIANVTGTYGTFKLGSVILANTASAVSTNTGALQVSGGIGVNGDVFVGGVVTATNHYGNISTINITTYPAGSNANLLIDPDGSGDVIFSTATQVVIYDTSTSVSTTTGALVVTGGIGIGGGIFVGKNSTFSGTVSVGTQTVFTNAGVSVGPMVYFIGTGTVGTVTIPDTCQYYLMNSTFTSMTLVMPTNPLSGQVLEISTRYTLSGLTHQASSGQLLSGGLSTAPLAGSGGKWVYFNNGSTSTWFRLDKAV